MIDDRIDDTLTEPTEHQPLPPSPPPSPSRQGLTFFPALFLALLLLAGGAGVGWWLGNDGSGQDAVTVEGTPAARETTATIEPGEEPVAAVAAALLPSMVQIDHRAGLGSGFVYEEGHVLTAAHVVDGVDVVQVRFADGTVRDGQVVGADAPHDIAVIAVDTEGVPAAPLAIDEELEVGQLAVALGSPWGLEQTVTSGVVSAVSRPIASPLTAQVLIQTDASINPGNSGGALANRMGEVIGVNIQIFTTTGSNTGVGFAVPIGNAFEFASAIVAGDPIETAFLGVSGEAATGEISGAVISELTNGGAAGEAGLQVGDIVTAVDGQAVRSIQDLAARIRSYLPGDEVTIDAFRDGELVSFKVVLRTAPPG
ncbi:MAG TPA: trypsin-like peptidase domain-containing protein [Acidimicrobiia bacterium]|nr:trypsin-like peptidase domain-containing protein [Acidimicrobiia bacterium]